MFQFLFSVQSLIDWALLAIGAVMAALAGRRGGRLAVIGVFCAVWAILFSLSLMQELRLFQYNSIGRVLSEFWKGPTTAVAVTMIPLLWLTGKASVRKAAAWGIGGATIVMFVLPPVALIGMAYIPADHNPCSLPSLESSIPSRTVRGIGTDGYFSDTCPIPIARELEFDRDYGTVNMYWWGTPHRLRISGQTPNGEPLGIGVNRVDPTGRSQDSPEPGDERVVTFFQGQSHLIPADPPHPDETEAFSITVFGADGESLEDIPLRYLPRRCTCVFYDSL